MKAAAALASRSDVGSLKDDVGSLKDGVGELKRDVALLKWGQGATFALVLAVLVKLFLP